MEWLILGIIILLTLINVPIGFALSLSAIVLLLWKGSASLSVVPLNLFSGASSFPLLAIPLFILAGGLMETSGISLRLVNMANSLVGFIRGGLAMVTVVATMIQSGDVSSPEMVEAVKGYAAPLKDAGVDTVILGCTHYPLIKNAIQGKIGRKVIVVDSAEEVVGKVLAYLQNHPEIDKNLARGQEHQFFVSDLMNQTASTEKKWLGQDIKLNVYVHG